MLSATDFEEFGDSILTESGGAAEEIAKKLIEERDVEKKIFGDFRDSLSAAVASGGEDQAQRLIIVVDELDRCRPDFALEVIETAKHLYNVPGVCFIFGLNKSQFESAMRGRYGLEFDAQTYLQKFFEFEVPLEIPAYGKNSGVQRYVRHLFPDVSAFSDESCYEDFIEYFVVLGNKFDMSFRALERARSQFLLYTKYRAGLRRFECYFLLGLAVLKVTHPKLFRSIISSTSEIHEMRNLLIDRAFSPSGRHEWKMFTASLAIISIERPSDLSTLPEDTYDAVSSIERLFLLHNVKLVNSNYFDAFSRLAQNNIEISE
jgi:hypothetical protein